MLHILQALRCLLQAAVFKDMQARPLQSFVKLLPTWSHTPISKQKPTTPNICSLTCLEYFVGPCRVHIMTYHMDIPACLPVTHA